MNIRFWQVAALLMVGVLGGWGASAVTSGLVGGGGASEVLATIGQARVTRADVQGTTPEAFLNLERRRHALTEQSLEQTIRLKLVEVEAAARGMAQAELVRAEVYDQVPDPTSEEIEAVYRRSGASVPLSQAEPQIRSMLRQQAQNARYEEFLAELRERHPVRNRFEPLRAKVPTEGFPSRGPADAPVTVVEFSDFQCPYCAEFVGVMEQVMAAYPNEVRFVYRHFPLSNIHPGAQKAAEASMCAQEEGQFWAMHDALFANQTAFSPSQLKSTARSLGLAGDTFDECLDSGRYASAVEFDLREGRSLGVSGTPGIFVNGRFLTGSQSAEEVAAMVVDELRRAGRDVEPRRIPPLRVAVEADGFPAKGPPDAPVTIVEFSDFQCPFCQRILDPLDQVLEAYGDRVRLVYRQFPIEALHPEAPKAAEASLCAHAEGRFWEMHDAIFAEPESLNMDVLKRMARSVGLNGQRFDACLDSGEYAEAVRLDLEAGRGAGVTGTPAMFINGRLLRGFQNFDAIAAVIEDELKHPAQ